MCSRNGSTAAPRQVIERFRASSGAVLLGVATFWEGIDVVGPALSALVIAKLPFAVPSEPVFAARGELFDDPFRQFATPQAVLKFKQGFGRLIRSSQDRGVCVVLIVGSSLSGMENRLLRPRRLARLRSAGLTGCPVEPSPGFTATPIKETTMSSSIDRNLALELARVTEAAALMAARWMGRGDKDAADQAAVDAMRAVLGTVRMDGVVVIGEGEKDEAPMLYIGEHVGTGEAPKVDIAVDPIDGTRLLSLGMPNAVAVVALAERGSMFSSPDIIYMEKIAVGPEAAACDRYQRVGTKTCARIARAKQLRRQRSDRRRARPAAPRGPDRENSRSAAPGSN